MHVIIPAGGAGTRLWPLSRQQRPKFLLRPQQEGVEHGPSLLQATVARLAPLAESYLVITGQAHVPAVTQQLFHDNALTLGKSDTNIEIISEPSARNTMPAIGLAAAICEQKYGAHALVGSFAADHIIADEDAFRLAVAAAMRAAEAGNIVTIGINPTGPATGYGYIVPQAGSAEISPQALRVQEFTEKPDAATAAALLQRGALWNAGMFISQAGILLDTLAQTLPQMTATLRQIAASWQTPERDRVLAAEWPKLTAIAIDHAVAEPAARAGKVAVVPASVGWSDVGDFAAWSQHSQSVQLSDIASPGAWAVSSGPHVAVVGIPDALVAVTDDAVLVTTRSAAERVGEVVKQLPLESPLR